MTIAWLFPGQGSQIVGMGLDLLNTGIAQEKFAEAEQILGWSVVEKCQGEETELAKTIYTQPCLYVIEAILSDLLKEQGHKPDVVAGHSLGEYSALYAAQVFDFASGLVLVKQRSQLMSKAAGGKMAALMKFDRPQLEKVLAQTADVVLANDNSEEQVVISGTPVAVDKVLEQVKAKRAIPLKVSGAFHSPFMAEAAAEFEQVLAITPFTDAQVPVLSNFDPTPATAAEILKQRSIEQMTGSVRWRETMLNLPSLNVTEVWEIGPGKVLAGLIKRACPDLIVKNVDNLAAIA
ncbi:MAG: ACP S-malonyltransferase [Microcystaceae cyanobacterium]